jgi:hypothetical protein
MLKTLLVMAALLAATAADAQGVARSRPAPEWPIVTAQNNGSVGTGANVFAAAKTPTDRGVVITSVAMYVFTGGGGGAGTTVLHVTDGTSTCVATFLCTDTSGTGTKSGTLSGTCTFGANKWITIGVNASTCTTTQPSARNMIAMARPL